MGGRQRTSIFFDVEKKTGGASKESGKEEKKRGKKKR